MAAIRDMKRVDAHHHLWDHSVLRYPWHDKPHFPGDHSIIQSDYLIGIFLADAAGCNVVKSVHLQADCEEHGALKETQWLQSVADKHGFPHAIVAFVDFAADDADQQIAEHAKCKNVRGFRYILNHHYTNPDKCVVKHQCLSRDPAWRRGFAHIAKHNLSYDLQIWAAQQADEAVELMQAFPSVQFIINHTGMPTDRSDDDIQTWKNAIVQLASQPNAAIKISGLGMVDNTWTTDSIRPFVLHTISAFGVERCMFASNFPVDKLFSDYQTVWRAYEDIVTAAGFSVQAVEQMFHDNAVKFYRL